MVDNANYANENANLAFDLHDCYRMDSLLVVAVLANEIHASYVVATPSRILIQCFPASSSQRTNGWFDEMIVIVPSRQDG